MRKYDFFGNFHSTIFEKKEANEQPPCSKLNNFSFKSFSSNKRATKRPDEESEKNLL